MWKCQTANLQSTHVQPLCHAPAARLVPNVVHGQPSKLGQPGPSPVRIPDGNCARLTLQPRSMLDELHQSYTSHEVHAITLFAMALSARKGGVNTRRHALDLYHRTAY